MAFTKIVSPGIDTTGSYTVQQLNTVGVMTAGTVQVGAATTVHSTGIDLGSGNITSHNINSTGIITATSFVGPVSATNGTFSGNVSIGGTLTYEDVTNIDSVGVITARDGLNVTGGRVLIGTTTEGESGADDLTIATSSTTGITIRSGTSNAGNIYFSDGTSGAAEYRGQVSYLHNEDSLVFGTDGAERLRITSNGYARLTTSNARLEWTASSGSNPFIRSIGSGQQSLEFNTGGDERLRIKSDGHVGINDNNPDTQLSVNSGATNVVAKFASTDQYAWIQFRDNSTTDTAVMVGADGDNLSLRAGSNERVRVTSGGTVKFATNNSSTDYLEWGGNPRLMLQAPAGLNGLRVYGTTTPFEIGGSASTRKVAMGGNPNYDLSISGSYSLSSGQHDSSPKVFLNATRHNGSGTVTSFQTSIQAVSASNTASDGYLGLGASATPDDLVIRPSGYIGINHTSPGTRLVVKQNNGVAYNGNAQSSSYNAAVFLNESGHTNGGTYTGFQFNITGDSKNRVCSMGMISESSSNRNSSLVFHTDDNNNRSEKLRIKSGGEITNGNLSINGYANQNTPSGYSQYQSDNHANTLFGQNLKLGTSGSSGNHQIEIINQHSTIGGAGMYIGGNGSNQQNQINFYAEAANQSAGTDVTANRRAQIGSSAFFTWVEPRNLSSNGMSYLRTFGFTFNLQDGETETLFYNPDGYRRIYYQMYVQSAHGSNGYGYVFGNISRYGSQIHDEDWHVAYTSHSHSGSVNGNVNHNGIKFTRSGYSPTNITYYVIVKCFSPAGGNPYSNSGLTDPSYRYFNSGY